MYTHTHAHTHTRTHAHTHGCRCVGMRPHASARVVSPSTFMQHCPLALMPCAVSLEGTLLNILSMEALLERIVVGEQVAVREREVKEE